jgi:hypothetical protein
MDLKMNQNPSLIFLSLFLKLYTLSSQLSQEVKSCPGTDLIENRYELRAVMNSVMNLPVPCMAGNYLISGATISFRGGFTEHVGLQLTLSTCIQEVIGLNLGSDTWYSNGGFLWYLQSPPGKCWDSTSIRPLPPPSISFPVHHSSTIKRYVVSILKASLNNPLAL